MPGPRMTIVVGRSTFIRIYPWYRTVLYEGDEGYVLMSAPVGHEIDVLPEGAEKIEVEGQTYSYAEWSSYQEREGGGYVEYEENGQTGFVNGDQEIGAAIDQLPPGAIEIADNLYQFDMAFFEQVEDENGTSFYDVVDNPDGEEVIELEAD